MSAEAPPTYNADTEAPPLPDRKEPLKNVTTTATMASSLSDGIPLPIVLPQTSKSWRGSCFSPFVRAYVPELAEHGIDQETFLNFIDGLNEAYIAHPAFDAVNIVASVISIATPVPDVQFAFGGLAIGAAVAGKLSTLQRTKKYLRVVNAQMFHPGGLHVSILTTEKMMEEVGCGEEALNLPPLETFADIDETKLAEPIEETPSSTNKTHPDDPRMRRIRALKGYVMPLDFDVPPQVSRENFIKRMGDKQVKWLSKRQQEKFYKKREKAKEKSEERQEKVETQRLNFEQEVGSLYDQLSSERAKFDKKMNTKEVASDPKKKEKVTQEYEKETQKIGEKIDKAQSKMDDVEEKHQQDADKDIRKAEEKEQKTARKIRWTVISVWDGEEDDADLAKITSNTSEL